MSDVKIKFTYQITEAAQRAELAAGRPAHRTRTIEVPPTPFLAERAQIEADGSASISKEQTRVNSRGEINRYREHGEHCVAHEADHVLTIDEIEPFILTCEAAVASYAAAKKAEHAEREAKTQAAREELSARVLATTVDDRWTLTGELRDDITEMSWWPWAGNNLTPAAEAHAEALRDAAKKRREAEAARREEEAEAARAAAARAAQKAKADTAAWLADHPTAFPDHPELYRAAREGRSVRSFLTQHLEQTLRDALHEAVKDDVTRVRSEVYRVAARDGVPSPESYALLDLLASRRSGLLQDLKLPEVAVEISDLRRFDIAPCGRAVWRTGVQVTADHPWIDTIDFYVFTEPMANDDDDDDD